MTHWPDDRRILANVLGVFGSTTYQLEPGFVQALADAPDARPIIHLTRVGGPGQSADGVERTRRLKVDVYAAGETAAEDVAEALHDYLVGHFHYDANDEDLGLIDTVRTESDPAAVPFPDDVVSLVSATYRTVCRPL